MVGEISRENVLAFVERCAQSDQELRIDFESLRPDRTATAVMTAALLGPLSARQIVVAGGARIAPKLANSGIAMALAQRSVRFEDGALEAALGLDEWRSPWTPFSRSEPMRDEALAQERLFSAEQLDEGATRPGIAGRYHGAFIDPHLAGRVGAPSPVLSNVEPWLYHVLPRAWGQHKAIPAVMDVVRSVSTVLRELLANVQEHAPVAGLASLRSEVTVNVVRASVTQVAITVIDSGPGIAATIQRKAPRHAERPMGTLETLKAALTADGLSFLGRGRGLGLPRVLEAAVSSQGSIYIATNGLSLLATSAGLHPLETVSTNLSGTVISVRIPLPAIASLAVAG